MPTSTLHSGRCWSTRGFLRADEEGCSGLHRKHVRLVRRFLAGREVGDSGSCVSGRHAAWIATTAPPAGALRLQDGRRRSAAAGSEVGGGRPSCLPTTRASRADRRPARQRPYEPSRSAGGGGPGGGPLPGGRVDGRQDGGCFGNGVARCGCPTLCGGGCRGRLGSAALARVDGVRPWDHGTNEGRASPHRPGEPGSCRPALLILKQPNSRSEFASGRARRAAKVDAQDRFVLGEEVIVGVILSPPWLAVPAWWWQLPRPNEQPIPAALV